MDSSSTPVRRDDDHAAPALAERDGSVASLTQALAERDAAIARLHELLGERGRSLHEMRSENAALRAELTRTHQSSSWRLTGPLRWALRRTAQGRASLETLLWAIRRRGPSATVAEIRRLRQGHGISGIKFWLLNGVAPGGAERAVPGSDLSSTHAALADLRGPDGYVYRTPRRPPGFEARLKNLSTTFSIVVPVYNTPPALLQAAVASVQAQWYPRWQLVLVDDASPNPGTQAALDRIRDPRITLLRQPANGGISNTTNAGLAAATGDFVVFLDHDDELTPDCLYELALSIAAHDPDFVYSDEDKLTEDGRFTQPFFKPDWSPDTIMSTMYTCHVACVRSSLLRELGGLRPEYDGCQDWDLVLRLAERTRRIQHVPKVLYHWRIIPQSTAADLNAKPYVVSVSERLRADTLARRGLKGALEPLPQLPSYHRVRYDVRGTPTISIIIPSRDNQAVLSACLDSIRARSSYGRYEIVVLDNGSREPAALGYLNRIRSWPGVQVIRHDAPFNYSELNNLGVAASSGDILLFLNDDTEVLTPDWLERMAGFAQLDHVGAVGAKLLYPGAEKYSTLACSIFITGPAMLSCSRIGTITATSCAIFSNTTGWP
ncbi:glycosyltransferase [Nitrospirillum sp. BR 11828]|uniref:glycosyltransferase n=1 Tax=Nitrospirillum sp. BR 11828 TaxID=3104325 RepID=UPI002ACA7BE3|nr:glycosyltransferase [Nitrospirillum sp. BR 11828]MDZ5650713.1 glycosyltransferase [Nitrospirillum sp. BR 11828]